MVKIIISYRFLSLLIKQRKRKAYCYEIEVSTEGIDLIDGPNEAKTSAITT